MINIRDSRQIFYDGGNQSVTIYFDAEDRNVVYVVPTPRFAVRDVAGKPTRVFSLTRYQNQDGAAGNCTFTVALSVPPAALEAIRAQLPDAEIAQFDWLSAQAYFFYSVGGVEQVLNAVPSMAGSNEATFSIDLPDDEAVNAFEGAFGPGQSVSPFRVEFDVTSLSQLPAVDVTVSYNAETAYEYEKTIVDEPATWSTPASRRENVKEYLRKSDAGAVDVKWHTPPGDDLKTRVYDWAWLTLENLVNQAVDEAIRTVGEANADNFSALTTSSFVRKYSENEVIEWVIQPIAQLPTFSEEEWPEHSTTVDNRRLVTTFNVLQDLDAAGIDAVTVSVDYPTRPTGASHVFTPQTPTSWIFEAAGDTAGGGFDPEYRFSYTVNYRDGKIFTSEPVSTADTQVILPLSALGLQVARFRGSNVDFENTVDFVEIDFFFATPGDQPNTVETRILESNDQVIEIPSRTYLPSANEYVYSLIYVFKDGRRVRIDPVPVFATQNQDTVVVSSPFTERQLGFKVLNSPAAEPSILNLSLDAKYVDQSVSGSPPIHHWELTINPDAPLTQSQPWAPIVLDNPAASYVEYNGTVLMSDFSQRQVLGFKTPNSWANFSNLTKNFATSVKPDLIAWGDGIQAVQVELWTLATEGGSPTANQTLVFQPNTDAPGQAPYDQLATFLYPADQPSLTYYWKAVYYYADGTEAWVDERSSSSSTIFLPARATSGEPVVHRVEVPREELETFERTTAAQPVAAGGRG